MRKNLVCRSPCGRGLNACQGPRVVERRAVINAMACLMQEPSQAIAQARMTCSELLHLMPILGEVEGAHGADAVNHPRLTSLSAATHVGQGRSVTANINFSTQSLIVGIS